MSRRCSWRGSPAGTQRTLSSGALLVGHPEHADRAGPDQAAGERRLGQQDQRVQRVAVLAQGVLDEAVVGRVLSGREQGPVQAEPARLVVQLVLVASALGDLDEDVELHTADTVTVPTDRLTGAARWLVLPVRCSSRCSPRPFVLGLVSGARAVPGSVQSAQQAPVVLAPAKGEGVAPTAAGVQKALAAILKDPSLGKHRGIYVYDASRGQAVFSAGTATAVHPGVHAEAADDGLGAGDPRSRSHLHHEGGERGQRLDRPGRWW